MHVVPSNLICLYLDMSGQHQMLEYKQSCVRMGLMTFFTFLAFYRESEPINRSRMFSPSCIYVLYVYVYIYVLYVYVCIYMYMYCTSWSVQARHHYFPKFQVLVISSLETATVTLLVALSIFLTVMVCYSPGSSICLSVSHGLLLSW